MFMPVAMLVAFVFISSMNMAVGKVIGYPAIGRNMPCDPYQSSSACPPEEPVNPYKRGCEKSRRCRGGVRPPPPVFRKMLE